MAALSLNKKHGVHVTAVAHMSLILLVVLLNLSATTAKSNCPAVKINGPYIEQQRLIMGVVFEEIVNKESGKPVFAFNTADGNRTYLFCFKNNELNVSVWGVGPSYVGLMLYMGQESEPGNHCADHPADDTRTWVIYDASKLNLVKSPTVAVECAQVPEYDTKTCNTVEIVGANIPIQSTRIGVPYTHSRDLKYGGRIRGKPIFRSYGGYYIYPCIGISILKTLFSQWCVGPKIANGYYAMFLGSDVRHPAEATGTWFIYDGQSFRPYPNVSVKCVEDLTSTKETSTSFFHYRSTQTTMSPLAGPTTKQPHHTPLIIGVAAAAVVMVTTLFVVFFLVIWKKPSKINRDTGNLKAVYIPEAENMEASRPPPYHCDTTSEAALTDYEGDRSVFFDTTGVQVSAKRLDLMCEKPVQI